MKLNPNLFFIMKEGKIIVWDYKHHQQFSLEKEYLDRLLAWSSGEAQGLTPLDQILKETCLIEEDHSTAHEWGWDILSHIYHIGTSDIPSKIASPEQWIDDYVSYCQQIAATFPKDDDRYPDAISLPKMDEELLKVSLLKDVLYQRKTCRSFYGMSMTLNQLSTLLYLSFGMIHKEWNDLEGLQQFGLRKAYPSGGGLHGEEIYLVVLRVDQLKNGIYHYDSQHHQLRLIRQGFFELELIHLMHDQWFIEGLSVGVFLTSQFQKTWWKYPHSRGYRVSLLDMGHASQTFFAYRYSSIPQYLAFRGIS